MPKSLPIVAVTFDLDDTLWDVWPTINRAEETLHNWLAARYPKISERYDRVALRELRSDAQAQFPDLGGDLTALRIAGLQIAARRCGYTEGFEAQAAFDVFYAARNDVLFFEDALPALEMLNRHFTLAALSNGNADVHQVGIGHIFDFALSPADVAKPKPAADMFARALCLLNDIDPCQVVHVGDDPHTDVWGATQLGWRTVWVNRRDAIWQHDFHPDGEVASLSELLPLLHDWQT